MKEENAFNEALNEFQEGYTDLMLYGFMVLSSTSDGSIKRVDPTEVIIGLKDKVVDLD